MSEWVFFPHVIVSYSKWKSKRRNWIAYYSQPSYLKHHFQHNKQENSGNSTIHSTIRWCNFVSAAVVCPCFAIGHFKGDGEKPVSQTVCCFGCCTGYNQAVLPCWRQWSEKDLPGEECRVAVTTLCSFALHSDHWHAHQNICHNTD